MDVLFEDFARAVNSSSGYQLAQTLSPAAPSDRPGYLDAVWRSTSAHNVKGDLRRIINACRTRERIAKDEVNGWVDVYAAYWRAVGAIMAASEGTRDGSWTKVYEAWREIGLALHRGYTNHGFEAWTIPCLYVTGRNLRVFAMRADEERASNASNANNANDAAADPASFQDDFDSELEEHQQLRDCEQQLKRLFTLCLSDRSPLEESRKWGIYYIINLLFKTYFKLNSASLSRTILKALGAYKGDMPPLEAFPRSQRVTFKYYEGVLFFLEENYAEAEKHLAEAWQLCHKDAVRNKERILTYLIPCRLLTAHTLPTSTLLEPYPHLRKLFLPISGAIRRGDLAAFDAALQAESEEFVRHRIYLTLERGRDIAMRNLLRKVFVVGGYDQPKQDGAAPVRRTRIPLAEFRVAINMMSGAEPIDAEEVECYLAIMIYKSLMKGYISRQHGMVVLSKSGNAFPGTGV